MGHPLRIGIIGEIALPRAILDAARNHDPQPRMLNGPDDVFEMLCQGKPVCIIVTAKTNRKLQAIVDELRPGFREEDRDAALILVSEESPSLQRGDPRPCGNEFLYGLVSLDDAKSRIPELLDRFNAHPQEPHCMGTSRLQISGSQWQAFQGILRAGFPGWGRIHVEPLPGGKSGALVALVTPYHSDGLAGPERFVVKIRSSLRLAYEAHQIRAVATKFLASHAYVPIQKIIHDRANGHILLVMPAVLDRQGKITSLRQLYKNGPGRTMPVLHALLEELRPWWSRAEQNPYSLVTAALGPMLNDPTRSTLFRRRLESLGTIKGDAVDGLRKLLDASGIDASYFSQAHGDLHGGNVLLRFDGRPSIIDFSRARDNVVATLDVATLVHDLLWQGMEVKEAREVLAHAVVGEKPAGRWAKPIVAYANEFCKGTRIPPQEFWATVMLLAAGNLSFPKPDRQENLETIVRDGVRLIGETKPAGSRVDPTRVRRLRPGTTRSRR